MTAEVESYEAYLTRFGAELGADVEVGGFAKYKGKLIKKMAADEFAKTYAEYEQMAAHYFASIDRGDTINDVIVRAIRENAANLVLTSPV